MVEELLDFTRMQDGRFTLRVEETDLLAELEDAIFTYREIFSPGGHPELRYECADDLPPIIADGERMKQVFCNVLDNAASTAAAASASTCPWRLRTAAWSSVCATSAPGIPVEELPYVKQKFYKGRPRRAAAASASPCATRSCVCTTARLTLPTPRAAARS